MNKLNRIIIHHTAGTYLPNSIDRLHYHFLYGKNKLYNGLFKPDDNIDCKDEKYAAHTGGGNTGSIGVAFCGNLGFKNSLNVGDYPLLPEQLEMGYKHIAYLCKLYNIPVLPQSVITHYEFGQANPKTSSYRKIDITFLPTDPSLNPGQVGNKIREKIHWYYERL